MGYNILAAIFMASDICATIVFCKFLDLNIGGLFHFETPAGTLIYPITFLMSDIITEIYGKEQSKKVVLASFFANLYVVFLLKIVGLLPTTSFSIVSSVEFHKIFDLTSSAFFASSIAFLFSQFLDIQIFHSLKCMTPNRFLWLRNGVSTIISQFMDTSVFFLILFILGVIPIDSIFSIFLSTIVLKVVLAVLSTPFFYAGVFLLKKNTEHAGFAKQIS
jgi:uncharacterized integral membrane protein (TIGR00697 family)